MNNILYVYIDESGDFGFSEGISILYIVSFVFYDDNYSIDNDVSYLNNKLVELGHKGMIHTALLISRKNEYNKWSLEKRKEVFYALYNFARKIRVRLKSIVIDKKYSNNRLQLKKKLRDEIEKFVQENNKYISSYKKVIVYYDDGQDSLGDIIRNVFLKFDNVKFVSEFNHEDNRIFQVADMLTVIDKLDFRIKNKIEFSKNEKEFFDDRKVIYLISDIKYKRFK